MRQRRKCRQADEGLGNDARTRTRRAVEHPRRKLLPASPIGAVQRATEINAIRLRSRRMDMNGQAKPRMPSIENFADTGPVGVLNPCCTMDRDPTPALTGRRRIRPTSPGCRIRSSLNPAGLHLLQRTLLFRATEPPLVPLYDLGTA